MGDEDEESKFGNLEMSGEGGKRVSDYESEHMGDLDEGDNFSDDSNSDRRSFFA